jgi:hypothetical protein
MALAHVDPVGDEPFRTTILLTFGVYHNRPMDATAIINNIPGRNSSLAGYENLRTRFLELTKNDMT